MHKKIFYAILLCNFIILNARSQSRADEQNEREQTESAAKIFREKDADFDVKTIPDKWQSESAVIIAEKFDYSYTTGGGRLLSFSETTRRKIKILDKAAVENFSTFYIYSVRQSYAGRGKNDNFAIRIIKPDGKINTVYKKDAIKVEGSSIPSFYRAHVNADLEYYKVAVPDIIVGDIIDYFMIVNGVGYNYGGGAKDLPPVIATLNTEYPVMKEKINFVVDRGFFINFKSTNGAPDLKRNPDIGKYTYSYSLQAADLPQVSNIRWLYPYRELPTIKFQVVFSHLNTDSEFFLGDIDEPKTSVTADEIAQKVNFALDNLSDLSKYYVDAIKSRMRRQHGDLTDKNQIAKYAYYYFRNIAFSSSTYSSYSAIDIGYMPSRIFTAVMYEVLQDYDIPCEVIVVPDRNISTIKDVVLSTELNYCIKVGDQYLFTFDLNSNYNDIDQDLAEQSGYAVKVSKREKGRNAVPVTLPNTNATHNSSLFEINATVDENMENLNIQQKVTVKGSLKKSYNDEALYGYDWEKKDYLSFGGTPPEEKKPSGNKSKIEEEERRKQAHDEQTQKDLKEKMKDFVKSDFTNVVSYDEFKLESDGRTPDQNTLIYSEKFTVGDLIKKAGPNYAVSIGTLIGGQVEIQEKERKRDYNVWISYPRTLEYKVTFNIPAGYKVQGIDALNFNVDYPTGSFISTAKVEGQKLSVEVKKIYKSNFVKKEDWPKVVEFLDASYNFTQKKVIISK